MHFNLRVQKVEDVRGTVSAMHSRYIDSSALHNQYTLMMAAWSARTTSVAVDELRDGRTLSEVAMPGSADVASRKRRHSESTRMFTANHRHHDLNDRQMAAAELFLRTSITPPAAEMHQENNRTDAEVTGVAQDLASRHTRMTSMSTTNTSTDVKSVQLLTEAYRCVLAGIGEDPNREGLLKTPERAAKAMLYFTKGYEESVAGN